MEYIVTLNTVVVAVVGVIQLIIALDERRQSPRKSSTDLTLAKLSDDLPTTEFILTEREAA